MTAQSPIFTTPGSVKHETSRLEFDSTMRQQESEMRGGEMRYTYVYSPEDMRMAERK